MSGGVKILNTTEIAFPSLTETPPPMKLSFFDYMWVGVPPVQGLLLYTNSSLPFSSLVENLKSSLSLTLLDYLPLLGKLTYVASTGDVEIDFSDPRIAFIEAESDLDIHRLATDSIHDIGSFKKLVPALDTSLLPCSIFAAQATRFSCGGVAIGYCISHAVADGRPLVKFVTAWADSCRAQINGTQIRKEHWKPPPYDRAVIKHPKAEVVGRQILRNMTPNLPHTRHSTEPSASSDGDPPPFMKRTFVLDAQSIQVLRDQGTQTRPPSTFSAISAYVFACIARAKRSDPNQHLVLGFLFDCRSRLDPPVDDDYFGNCVRGVDVEITVRELTGNDGLLKICVAIRRTIDNVSKDPLSDCEDWVEHFKTLPFDRMVTATASPRFRVYDADFGWGRPDRFELVSMNGGSEFALYSGKEEGTVQVSISLPPNQMETFAEHFVGGLKSMENAAATYRN